MTNGEQRQNRMWVRGRTVGLLLGLAVFAMVSPASSADSAVALLLEVNGVVAPNVDQFTEISSGADLSLTNGAAIRFLHYATCQEVTVTGGRVTFTEADYEVEGGDIESRQVPCPLEHRVETAGVSARLMVWGSGSVRIRGSGSEGSPHLPSFPPRPSVILTGTHAKDFSAVSFTAEGQELLQGQLEGRRYRWPPMAESLVETRRYTMQLIPVVPAAAPLTFGFHVSSAPPLSAEDSLVLIRLGSEELD